MINEHVALATAAESRRPLYNPDLPMRWRCGGRCGTVHMTLEAFARRLGPPHEAVPREDWRTYLGAVKVSASWRFTTPRGLIEVSDYWWNAPDHLSVRAGDLRALIWFRKWCRAHDIRIT